MPFDGNPETFVVDEATQILVAARELLVKEGWCIGSRQNERGEHCALGALDAVSGRFTSSGCYNDVVRLADAVPNDVPIWKTNASPVSKIAWFNNSQTSIEPILSWFDRAIAAR